MPRIVAIDWGLKRIGLAISDEKEQIAFPLHLVLAGKNSHESIQNILAALSKYMPQIEKIVIGLPLLLSGEKGSMALAVERFAMEFKKKCPIPIEFIDERLSSAMADRALKELSYSRKERSERIDSTAAVMLLQSYLARKNI